MRKVQFNGFPVRMLHFFSQLEQNNNRRWFLTHKHEYEEFVIKPSRAFITAMGKRLKRISKKIHAIPRINKSLFRIYKDMRFNKNSHPYKTHLGILFWEGDEKKRMKSPGFFFHVGKHSLRLRVGLESFPLPVLSVFRQKMHQESAGRELQKILTKIKENNFIHIRGKRLKQYPRGNQPHNENKEFFKYKGLYAELETEIPPVLHQPELIDYCYNAYIKMAPIHKWLIKL